MKKITAAIIFTIIPVIGICQSQYSARISIDMAQIGVSPSEELWVATTSGDLWHTDKIGSLWKCSLHRNSEFMWNDSYDQITVFPDNTIIISGRIREKNQISKDVVLRSEDGGKTWEKIKFGKDAWLYFACNTDDGSVWASGSSQFIYSTTDFGKTWTQIEKPYPVRYTRLLSGATSPDGSVQLFGTNDGQLYITKDNSTTFTQLPTPHYQGKYKYPNIDTKRTNTAREIAKIRIHGDRYLLSQDGLTFITMSNRIDWQPLKDTYDYEITEGGNLYVVAKDGSVRLYDKDFRQVWSSAEKMLQLPKSITCRNESLFAICMDRVYKINPNEFVTSELFTDDYAIGTGLQKYYPYDQRKLTYKGNTYTYDRKDLLRKDSRNGKWYRFLTPGFNIGNVVVWDDDLLIADKSLSAYYKADIENRTITRYVLPDNIIDMSNNPAVRFTMETAAPESSHVAISKIICQSKKSPHIGACFHTSPKISFVTFKRSL